MCLHIISDIISDLPHQDVSGSMSKCESVTGKELENRRFASRNVGESLRRTNMAYRYNVTSAHKVLFIGHHHC